MQSSKSAKSLFSKIDHIGVIVRDLDKGVKYYQSLGIGPFEPLNRFVASREIPGKTNGNIKLKIRLANMGQVKVELIEPVAGESPQKEFLENNGEGIHHLGFVVDDLDKEVAKLAKKGIKVSYRAKFLPSGGAVYLETNRIGGITLELIQLTPEEST
jgi:methylmalonyl-CoA epimerase